VGGPANYLRFRLAPEAAIALAARVKRAARSSSAISVSSSYSTPSRTKKRPTSGFLGDAMAGDGALFTPEDAVEAAWTVVDPVLAHHPRAHPYEPGTWGPTQADKLIASHGRWHNPAPATKSVEGGGGRSQPRGPPANRPRSTSA
jgi:glucose-6-phosphate 1-dehydrogenase